MNADRLLALYDRVAEAPGAIARMRRFVLSLAVRGKLVSQDPEDEPAADLFRRTANERARGKARRTELQDDSAGSEIRPLWETPSGWIWVKLGATGRIFSGNSINAPTRARLEKTSAGRPFVATKDIGYGFDPIDYENGLLVPTDDRSFKTARSGSVFICAEGGSAGRKIALSDREICFGNKLLANEVWSFVSPDFVRITYMSDHFYSAFSKKMTGVIGGISIANFSQLPFPVPPLAEQRRIVAKVEELMALLSGLEAARTARESARNRLTTANLARLTTAQAHLSDFADEARFVLATFPALTTRSDQIRPLRQTILNLAVRGKLVKQDMTDEPAVELLRRLRSHPGQGPTVKAISSPVRETIEMPFPCPSGWAWVNVQQLLASRRDISYGIIKLGPEPKSGGVLTLRCSDVRPGFIDRSGVRRVEESIEADYARTRLEGGEIVINIRGTLGGVALAPEDLRGYNVAREVAVIPVDRELSGQFFVYLMLSPYFWNHIQENLRGIAYKGLNLGTLRDLPIPLPPVAEQHRIVDKVDALMALCDRLEAALNTADTTRVRLLEALLHEALMPPTAQAA